MLVPSFLCMENFCKTAITTTNQISHLIVSYDVPHKLIDSIPHNVDHNYIQDHIHTHNYKLKHLSNSLLDYPVHGIIYRKYNEDRISNIQLVDVF